MNQFVILMLALLGLDMAYTCVQNSTTVA